LLARLFTPAAAMRLAGAGGGGARLSLSCSDGMIYMAECGGAVLMKAKCISPPSNLGVVRRRV